MHKSSFCGLSALLKKSPSNLYFILLTGTFIYLFRALLKALFLKKIELCCGWQVDIDQWLPLRAGQSAHCIVDFSEHRKNWLLLNLIQLTCLSRNRESISTVHLPFKLNLLNFSLSWQNWRGVPVWTRVADLYPLSHTPKKILKLS